MGEHWIDQAAEVLSKPATQLVASVWWCGDEACDCYQAQISNRQKGQLHEHGYVGRLIDERWQGRFYTDGGHRAATDELRALRSGLEQASTYVDIADPMTSKQLERVGR